MKLLSDLEDSIRDHSRTPLFQRPDTPDYAVVFAEPGKFAGSGAHGQKLPKRWVLPGDDHIWRVHDGDMSRMRFPGMVPHAPKPDGKGCIIGLRLQSDSNAIRQRAIANGFCVSVATECQSCGAMAIFETELPVKCSCGKMVSHRANQSAKSASTDSIDSEAPAAPRIVIENLQASSHPVRDTRVASGTRLTAAREATVSMPETELLPCPNCGEQRRAKVEWIGSTEVCDCGQIYRFSLALTKVPAETDNNIDKIRQYIHRGWNSSLEFSHRELVPRLKQAWVYACEQIVPCIGSSLSAAYAWTVKAFRSGFPLGLPPRPDVRTSYNEPVNSDWVEVPVSPDRTKDTLSAITPAMPLVEPAVASLNNALTPTPSTDHATKDDSMTVFRIEDGLPVPKKRGPGRPYKYEFAEMSVGQSAMVMATYFTMKTCINKFCAKPENEGWEFQIERISEKMTRIHRIK